MGVTIALMWMQRNSIRRTTPNNSSINKAARMVALEIVTEDKGSFEKREKPVNSRRPRWGFSPPP